MGGTDIFVPYRGIYFLYAEAKWIPAKETAIFVPYRGIYFLYYNAWF